MDYPSSFSPNPASTGFVNNNNNPNATNPFQTTPQNPFAISTQDVNNNNNVPAPNLTNSFIAFDPIELIGQNTSTFDSKTNEKFFNQSSQIQLTEAVAEGSHLTWNNEEFVKRSDKVFQTSNQHASVLVAKQKQELESQHLHNSLWTFPVQQRTLNSMCGDDRAVTYSFQVKMASFNEHAFGILNLKFNELHSMNTTSVYSTLFEQSISEIQLSNYIQASLNSWKSDARSIKSILDNLFDIFNSNRKPVSAHSAAEIRQLIMFVGSFLLDYLPSETKTEDNLLFNIEDEGQRLKSISQIIPSISTYLLTKILPVQGCSWSISLLQPSETDVIQFRWLEILFCNTQNLYDENEYLLIIGQIPWRQIGARCSVEDVKKHILLPLQKALEILSPRPNYARLVLTLGKIVSLIACMFPTLLVQCLANLTRSPWPSKMIFSTLLNMLPWKYSNVEDLSVIFSELMHLFNVKLQDYSSMIEEKKSPMRLQYRDYLLHNQMLISQTYMLDPVLSDHNGKSRFPTLVSLTTLCIHAISLGDLEPARILTNELFYFSFICPVPQHPEAASWMPYLRSESSNQLGRLCTQYPPAMNWVVNAIGQGLPSLNPDQIDYFLTNQVNLSNWKLDQGSLNWLSYLLAHRALPQIVDMNTAADVHIQHYLFAKPQVSFPPQVNTVGIRIGCKLCECIQWSTTDTFMRNVAVLILLAGKSIGVSPDWLWTSISSPKLRLLSAPFHDQFMNKLLQLRTAGLFCEDEVTLVQILLAVAIVEDKPKQQGFKWLEDWGLYGRLENIVQKNIKGPAFQNILFNAMNLVKFDAYRAAPAISKVIFTALAKNPNLIEDVKAILGKSLLEPKDHDRWLVLWSLLICPRTPENQLFCSLLNLLVHQIFFETETTMDIVIQPLVSRNMGRKEVNKLISDKYIWMAYAAVQAYQPALPLELTSILTMTDSNVTKAVKDTRFWYLKEIAMNMEDGVLALLFWEQFFLLYFDLAPAVANKIITSSIREQLNKHFVSTAQDYSNIKKVYTLYYSFTTWSKDVIIGNRPRMFLLGEAEEGPSILESMVSIYPIQFPAISDLSKQIKALSVTTETSPELPVLINQLITLLPKKTARYQRVPVEEFKMFLQQVLHIADNLEHTSEVEIVSEMRELMFQYYAAVHSLKTLDDQFLNLTKTLYVNYAEPFTVTVPCSFGPQCASPGIVRGQSIRIGSATPTTREDILKNREQFNKLYSDFFTLSRKIAYKQSILDHLGQYLLQPATINSTAGVTLFFSLSKLILQNMIPLDTISKRLNQLTRDLGTVYIKDKPEHQQQLLNLLLSFSRAHMPTTSTEKYLSYLYDCFTPACHLISQDYNSYIQLIGILSQVPTALPVNEERQIAARFEADKWIPAILPSINDTQLQTIFTVLPGLMTKTSLIPLCSVLVQSLISFQFPRYLEPVMSTILGAVMGGNVTQNWDAFFSSVKFEALDASMGKKLLHTLASKLPLPDQFMASAIQLAKSIIMDIPALVSELIEESGGEKSLLWDEIVSLFSQSLKPIPGKGELFFLSESNFVHLLNLLNDIVTRLCSPLINKVWYLYRDVISPFLIGSSINSAIVFSLFQQLPWSDATFHLKDVQVVESMADSIVKVDHSVPCFIFSKLDWDLYVKQIEKETPDRYGKFSMSWLKLLFFVQILEPQFISEIPKIDHKSLDLSLFHQVFNGSTFSELLLVRGTKDPSKVIMQSLLLLNDIVVANPQYEQAAIILVTECRSLMFFSLQNDLQTKMYWALPFQDHVTLLTMIVMPMARYYSKSPRAEIQLLAAILTYVNYLEVWPVPILLAKPRHHNFFNTSFVPGVSQKGNENEARQLKEFSMKIHGIVMQFASSVSSQTALEILNIAAQAIHVVPILIEVFEETLSSYFAQTNSPNHGEILSTMQLPTSVSWETFTEMCVAQHKGLTLRFALEQKKRALSEEEPVFWTIHMCELVDIVMKYPVAEINVVLLWFFVLDLIADPKWLDDKTAALKVKEMQKHLQAIGGMKAVKLLEQINKIKTKNVELQLTSRGCLLFLNRLWLEKRVSSSEGSDEFKQQESKKLVGLQDKILQYKNDPAFAHYGQFFSLIETCLSPLCSLKDFKLSLVKIVAPIYPAFENVL